MTRHCAFCGDAFEAEAIGGGANRRFCHDGHRHAFHNLSKAQGVPLIPLMKAWRVARSGSPEAKRIGAAAFSEICAILDLMIADDRADGRSTKSMLEYARDQLDGPYCYLDRTKR